MSRRKAAEVFKVGEATVYRLLKKHREGDLKPKSPPGRPQSLDEKQQAKLLAQVEAEADLSLPEHAELYLKTQGVKLSASSVANYFARLGVRRKKESASQ